VDQHALAGPNVGHVVVVEPDHRGLEKLSKLVESGHLRVHVEHVFRLAEAAQAHERLTGRAKGKIVLTL
jgi:NADPH:quinone reductase-like Zn-dependent oxidoreductase